MRGRTSIIVIVSLASIIVLIAIVASARNSDLRAGSGDPDFPQPTVVIDGPMVDRAEMSTEQKQRAVDKALTHPRVLDILDGAPYHVAETVPWTGQGLKLEGAVVNLTFNESMTFEGDWLAFSWDCEMEPIPPPEIVEYTATYTGVTELYIFVNVESHDVDQIFPIGEPGIGTRIDGDMVFTGEQTSVTSCYSD